MSDEDRRTDALQYVDLKTGHLVYPQTDDALIARALEIRDDIEALKKQHGEELEPYEMGLQAIENALLARMVERQSKSIGTVHGTAYQSHQLRVKVADREQWLAWILELPEVRVDQFMTNHVSKEAIKAHLEDRLAQISDPGNPPGIETTTFVQCNIRKA